MVRILNMHGMKDLFKGHSTGTIKDMSFSKGENDEGTYSVCSADESQVVIWDIVNNNELSHSVVAVYPFGAVKVRSHPLISGVFLIADQADRIGVISPSISPSELSISIRQHGYAGIVDMCFASNTRTSNRVFVAVDNEQGDTSKGSILGIDTTTNTVFTKITVGGGLFGVQSAAAQTSNADLVIFTFQSENSSDVTVKAWSYSPDLGSPSCDQTLHLNLPV